MVKSIPRPGRRAASLVVGFGALVVMVDAVVHPGQLDSLWTSSLANQLAGWFGD
jgi:hypothetical protein